MNTNLINKQSVVIFIMIVLVVVLMMAPTGISQAGTFTAMQSGSWHDPNTWGGAVPGPDDDKVIPAGINVFIGSSIINRGTIDVFGLAGGIGLLSNEVGGVINVSGTYLNTAQISNYGTINNNGTLNNLGFIFNACSGHISGNPINGNPVVFEEGCNQPPDCANATPSHDFLWPPNHQMVEVSVQGVTDADGDAVSITIDSIRQDEPVNGTGDGDTAPDGAGVGTSTASLRAERAGDGNGRMYYVGFTADDGNGGTCQGEVRVGVNHNQGKKGAAVPDGSTFDSTLP